MNEKFSIITASYNYQDYIKETIESVINQTYANWEMIIVDDGSKDNSVEVIKSYCQKDERIKLFQHENGVNKGLVETIKLAIQKTSSQWIVFLESDDIITPEYLEKKLNIIENNAEVGFIFNDVEFFGDEKAINDFDGICKIQEEVLKDKTFITVKDFEKINPVKTFSCVAIKKELLENIDFNTPVKQWVDYYLWMQVASKCKLYYIEEKLTKWRMHKNSYNNSKIPDKDGLMFKIKKTEFLNPEMPKFMIYIKLFPNILKYLKRRILRISFKEKSVTIFGKEFKKNSL